MFFTAIFTLMAARYGEQSARTNRLLDELRAANAELEAAREREKELAVTAERVRLARDIHDGLGHHLTVLNVQLQAAGKLIVRDPVRAAAAIATSREVAQAALDEVRGSVAALRASPLDSRPLDEALHRLVHDFDRRSSVASGFEQHGLGFSLPPAAALTLYRAAQEGLTNAQKHSAAQRATVVLHYAPHEVAVKVWNDGDPLPTGELTTGFGLAGLRERAQQLGGTLHAAPLAEGGFWLKVTLPTEATQNGNEAHQNDS